jgi:hypothetical protein
MMALRDVLRHPRALVRAAGFDVVRSSLYVDRFTRLQALGFTLVSWEDVMIDPETGFVLQADCIFVV